MIIHRTFLLILACIAGASATFAQTSDTSTTLSSDIAVPFVAGGFRGLLTGTSGGPGNVQGDLTVRVVRTGSFTANLNLRGTHIPFMGAFATTGTYSTTLQTGSDSQIGVSLSFTGTSSLAGTITDAGQTLDYSGGLIYNNSPAGGHYRFIISPGQIVGSGTAAPQGTGYGSIHVHTSGQVVVAGRLPDGSGFSTASFITSGSSVPIYAQIGSSPYTGIAGTLVFQDIPNVSDCQGILYWSKPPGIRSQFPVGYELATQFVAASENRFIVGLKHDVATFTASGANLPSTITADITLFPIGKEDHGGADKVHLNIDRARDTFFGMFLDPTTNLFTTYAGVLLPKSRSGAGLFFSHGLSGTVTVKY